jgi:hypothetical protein
MLNLSAVQFVVLDISGMPAASLTSSPEGILYERIQKMKIKISNIFYQFYIYITWILYTFKVKSVPNRLYAPLPGNRSGMIT